MHAGQVVRSARKARDMTLAELGDLCGYSAAQISRYERGITRLTDIALLKTFSIALAIPPETLGLVADDAPAGLESAVARNRAAGSRSVAVDDGKEDPVRRRELLAAAGLAAPAALLARVDVALAMMPAPRRSPSRADVDALLVRARDQFDAGRLAELVRGVPGLLAAGHDLADRAPGNEHGLALLAACYDIVTEGLHKAGGDASARITADRAVTYARLSGDLAAQAMAARSSAVILRHEDRPQLAADVTRAAAERLAGAGFTDVRSANALAAVLCTAAYNAAQAGDRAGAETMITEAGRVSRWLPADHLRSQWFQVTPAQVNLYRVGIMWSAAEPGQALAAARGLRPEQFPTAERRARLLTDIARIRVQAGQPDRAIGALLAAAQHAASEVRDRTSIRSLALDLVRQQPTAPAAERLAGVLAAGRPR